MPQPNCVILDASNSVRLLRNRINGLPDFEAQEELIMTLVFETMYEDEKAEVELQCECLNVFADALFSYYEDDVRRIVNAINVFGTEIHAELQEIGAYQNGKLNFSYKQMLGEDIVLVAD
jgi:hypothetical protein